MQERAEGSAASPYAGLAGKIRAGGSASAAAAAETPPQVRIIRSEDYASVGDVLVDDAVVAQIASGERLTINIPAGKHRLAVRVNRSTAVVDLEIENGQAARFQTFYEGPGGGFRKKFFLIGLLIRPTGRGLLDRVD
jgi:hypothetical protein